jgi:uncharacterized protein (TIGR03437 family)
MPSVAVVRARGQTELIAPIDVVCSGTRPASGARGSITVNLNVPITSRVLNASGASEALVLVDNPAPGLQIASPVGGGAPAGANVFQGLQFASNGINFGVLEFAPAGPAGFFSRSFRIVNVRANASTLNWPATITATVTVASDPFVPVTNNVRNVATLQPNTGMSVRTIDDLADANVTLNGCSGHRFPFAGDGQPDFHVRFTEGNSAEFRERTLATSAANPAATGAQNDPAVQYNTESGFYNPSFPATSGMNLAGLATQGSRLVMRMHAIPPGAQVYVTQSPVTTGTSPTGISARLVSTDSTGAGSGSGIPPVIGDYVLLPVTNGQAAAVWEVYDATADQESISFGVVISVPGNQSASQLSVVGFAGPFGNTVTFPNLDRPLPLFAQTNVEAQTPARIASCASVLMVTSSCPLPAAPLNQFYSHTLTASGGVPPYRWQLILGSLPTGISLSSNGVISGTAAVEGNYPFVVNLIDATNSIVSKDCSITVAGTLQIATTCPLPETTLGANYSMQLAAVGGRPPYQWTISSGGLPPGLALGSTGVISGIVGASGDYAFTLRAQDSALFSVERPCQMRVTGPFRLSAPQLEFTAAAGSGVTISQSVYVTSAVPGQQWTTRVSTTDGARWLRATPSLGPMPGIIEISTDATGLPAGTYTGSVLVSTLNLAQGVQSINVTLRVGAPAPIALVAQPAGLAVSVPTGGGIQSRIITLQNSGSGLASFTASASVDSPVEWLAVGSASGNVTPESPFRLPVRVNPLNLAPGVYRGRVRITATNTGITTDVPVTLLVSAGRESIQLSQTGVSFVAASGGSPPREQVVRVLAAGGLGFNWTATSSVESTTAVWLALAQGSGTSRPGDPGSLTLRANHAGLNPGFYHGQVVVRAETDNTPRLVHVTLRVLPAGQDPGIDVTPASVFFTARAVGAEPSTQIVTVFNRSNAPVTLQFALPTDTRGFSAVALDPATIAAGGSSRISVGVNRANLEPGIYRLPLYLGTVNGPNVRSVELTLVLASSSPASLASPAGKDAAANYAAALSCSTANLVVSSTILVNEFTAAAGSPVPLEFRVTDRAGLPFTSGNVTAVFSSGGAALNLIHSGNGIWSGTWQPTERAAGPVSVYVFADDPERGNTGCNLVRGVFNASPDAPALADPPMVSAASFAPYAPVAPGGMVAVFGSKLAGPQQSAAALPLPVRLSGAEVTAASLNLPLIFAGDLTAFSQINGQLPYNLPVNVTVPIAVRAPGGIAFGEVAVAPAQPSVFTVNQSGSGQGIIVHGDNPALIADAQSPVERGRIVVIYCEGLGATQPTAGAGQASPGEALARVVAPVTVDIGGVAAPVSFAGLTPGFAGLYQINATVPESVQPGSTVPVVVTAAGNRSRTVTMAVR